MPKGKFRISLDVETNDEGITKASVQSIREVIDSPEPEDGEE